MTALAPEIEPSVAPPLDPAARHAGLRRSVFYPKADLAIPDAVLRALAAPDAEAVLTDAAHARGSLARVLGCDAAAVRVEPLSQQGTFHHVFAGGLRDEPARYVVRVNRLAAQFVDCQLLADPLVATALASRGIRCARVIAVDVSRRHVPTDVEVLERLAGRSLAEYDHDDAALAPHLAQLAMLLRQVHGIEGAGHGFIDVGSPGLTGIHASWDDYLFTQLAAHLAAVEAAGLVTATEVASARDAFDAARPDLAAVPPRLLHGDPGNHNVVVDKDGVVLLDWEDALLGDPLFDIAFWATFHPERRWAGFFEAYFGAGWQPTRRFWLYFLRIALSKTVHRLRFGYVDKPGRPPAAARIQRALRGLAEAKAGAP